MQLRRERVCGLAHRWSGGSLEQLGNEGGLSLHVLAADPDRTPIGRCGNRLLRH
ncbi:MAG: hypothetical protein JO320_17310 [Alphaproteobacteria bacterium]|nr:hypothetical protein [Alphaproteobacteria bacterium]